jgi:hypothetical protein
MAKDMRFIVVYHNIQVILKMVKKMDMVVINGT